MPLEETSEERGGVGEQPPPVPTKPLSVTGRHTTEGEIDIAETSIPASTSADSEASVGKPLSENEKEESPKQLSTDTTDPPPLQTDTTEVVDADSKPMDTEQETQALAMRTKVTTTTTVTTTTITKASSQDEETTGLSNAPSDEDEELQRAKAMALAIQNNPNMTPDEIRQLLAQKDGMPTAVEVAQTVAPLIPGRLTTMMFQGTTTAATTGLTSQPTSAAAAESAASGKSFRERARGRFTDIMKGDITKHITMPTIPTTFMSTEEEKPTEQNSKKPSPTETRKAQSAFSKEGFKRAFRNPVKGVRTPPISPPNTAVDKAVVLSGSNAEVPPSIPVISEDGTTAPPPKSAPVRISGIAWKRRGGMGKFSTTAAWERRRIELQGSKLLYYSRDASEEDSTSPMDPRDSDILSTISGTNTALSDESQDQVSEGVVVTKRATWLEQAASKWVAGSDDPTSPRGYIDLAKEKATVQVSFGGSGAPSPFAISIKVGGETKWKLCFDYHKIQMEWLAALTDIVVQTSVDSYNALLLQAADPAYQTELVMFHPPQPGQPPSRDAETAGVNRLWMTGSYVVSSFRENAEDDASETNHMPDFQDDILTNKSSPVVKSGAVSTAAQLVDLDSDPNALAELTDLATKSWTIPEKNILYVVGVLNVALSYARNSSTTMDGFWYLVVISNLGIYLCLVKAPDWRSCLHTFRRMSEKTSGATTADDEGRAAVASRNTLKSSDQSAVAASTSAEGSTTNSPTGYIPVAGTTAMRVENPTDVAVNEKGEHFTAWRRVPGESLMVRSHGYLSSKEKVSSPGELFELVNVDVFESPHRYPDMAPRVKLPEVKFDDGGLPKTWRTPDTFIISIALPTDPPKLGRSSSDGGGYTITMYYQMKQTTRDILRRVTAEGYDRSSEKIDDPQKSQVNAVRLLEEWCRRAPTDDKFQARFKIVPNAHNLREIGMPSWISKYNGKPFLIKRPGQTGFLSSHPEISCMVFDVTLHPFPYLAKQAICFMKESYFKKVLVTFGFVIEGRADDELPECLIGLMQMCYPDPQYAIQAKDFFAGRSPRSF